MFGWEFPPHISGGLGTACLGLTQSLIKQKVEMLFVVPRLYGDETAKDTVFINASAVQKRSKKKQPLRTVKHREQWLALETSTNTSRRPAMTYIEVPAGFSAYEFPAGRSSTIQSKAISLWNYSLPSGQALHALQGDELDVRQETAKGEENESCYRFTGSYGPNLLEEVKAYGEVAAIIAENYSFDVIHVHDWMTFEAGIRAKKISKKPLVVHVHSTEVDRAGEHICKDVFALEKRGMLEADAIITVSNWTKQIVTTRYKIPAGKITVVHNGVLPKEKSTGLPFPEIGSHFVTFLGRVTHQKGPAFFVEAAYKVLQEFPEAHFIVAGAGDLLPHIIQKVAQFNMSSNFHFTGFLSGNEVDQIWSMTDVYVMPSVSEPFGISPLEAIQGGVPVILSNQSGVSEVMPHAIKVDFWDVKALAAAICSVLRYESLSHVLRQHSRQHIEHLTWDRAASGVKALYDELTRKKQ